MSLDRIEVVENNESQAPRLVTAEEAAVYLRMSPFTLEMWRRKGKGPAYIPGRPVRYLERDLVAWIMGKRVEATS